MTKKVKLIVKLKKITAEYGSLSQFPTMVLLISAQNLTLFESSYWASRSIYRDSGIPQSISVINCSLHLRSSALLSRDISSSVIILLTPMLLFLGIEASLIHPPFLITSSPSWFCSSNSAIKPGVLLFSFCSSSMKSRYCFS
jgi:hypothetical protein